MNKNKRIAPNVIRGGVAIPLKSNYFLMKGRTHREGGIDVGKDLEVEDGEIMKITKNNIKVLSAKPILNGTSPAEYATNGNIRKRFEQAFRAQERFKRINGLNDDGTKKENGGETDFWDVALYKGKDSSPITSEDYAKEYRDTVKKIDNILINNNDEKKIKSELDKLKEEIEFNDRISDIDKDNLLNDIEHTKKYPISHAVTTRSNLNWNKKDKIDQENKIPFISEKFIELSDAGKSTGVGLSTNQLDSIALHAGRSGLDIRDALGIVAQETTFGKYPGTTFITTKEGFNNFSSNADPDFRPENFIYADGVRPSELVNNHHFYTQDPYQSLIGEVSRQTGVGHGPSQGFVDAEIKYNDFNNKVEAAMKKGFNYTINQAAKHDYDIHPLDDAFKLYKTGKYNKGIKDNDKKVIERGNEVINSPEIKKWWNESGKMFYEKGTSEMKLGGKKESFRYIPSTGYRKKAELGEVMKVDENGNLIADIEPAVVTARKPLNEIVQSELIRRILLDKIKLFDDKKIPTYKIKSSINKKYAKLGTEEPIKLKEVVVVDTKKEMPKITAKATTKDPGIIKVENSNNKPKVLPKLDSSLLTKKAIVGPLKLNKDNKEKVIELPEIIVQDTKKPMPDIKSKATTKDPGIIIPKRRNNQKKINDIDSSVFYKKAKSLKSNGIIYIKEDTNKRKEDIDKRIENIDSSKLLNDEIKAKSNNEVQLASYKKEKTVNNNKDKVSYLEANPTFLPNLIGAGINLIGSGISYGINKKFLNELKAPKAPYLLQPTKLKTRINIKPQVNELKRTINRYNKYFDKNTASSQTAVGRRLLNEQTYIDNYNQLYGAKENQETQLINQDRLQQHETAKYNLTNYNNWLREKTNFENSVREKKSENAQMLTQNIAGSLTNFLDKQAQWKESMANIAALSAAYPDVTPEYMAEQGLPYALWLKQKRERKNNR